MQSRTLEILASKNEDDIPELKQNIGSIATAWKFLYSLETFTEFQQQGLLTKVKNEELKQLLKNLKSQLIRFEAGNSYIDNQYNTLIEPYFAKHINYTNNTLERYKEDLTPGGTQTDYKNTI